MLNAVLALVPSLGVLFLFVVVVKAMLEGDRRERVAQAQWDREQLAPISDASEPDAKKTYREPPS